MILDELSNLKKYGIDSKIVDFIQNIDPNILPSRYNITEDAYINIDEYNTRDFIKLESHKKYIDIQFLLMGEEIIYTTNLDNLEVEIPYGEEKDIVFYKTPNKNLNKLYLDTNNFALLYPNDAHSPCIQIESSIKVKKAIVKIKL